MSLNYAEKWQPELLEIFTQNTLCSPFVESNVRWLDAKTFHFTQMSVSGYKDHSRSGGWNSGTFNQVDKPYTCAHDRDVEFLVDKADVDETNATASIQNISSTFEKTQVVPEADALFFSTVATEAQKVAKLHSSTAASAYDTTNVFSKLKGYISAIKRYRSDGIIMYVSTQIMDLLEMSKDFTRKIDVTTIAEGGTGIETRITSIDGVVLMEVIDDDRFYTAFDWNPTDGGFTPKVEYKLTTDTALVAGKTYYTKSGDTYTAVASPEVGSIGTYYEYTGAFKINVLAAVPRTTKVVPKIQSIYYFAPGAHTKGDGYLYQNRALSGVFTFPNGKDGVVDSIYVDADTAVVG